MTTSETVPSASDRFFDQALRRIRRFLLAIGAAGVVICLLFFRWQVTAGFAVGATISFVNQVWLERAIDELGARITQQQSRERGGVIVFRALLRYVFIAAGAYVIFNVSLAALYGFLGGICLPIAAVACEVVVELSATLRRKF